MENNRFNRDGQNFNNAAYGSEDFIKFIARMLEMDDSTEISFGAILENNYNSRRAKDVVSNLPSRNAPPVSTEDFARQVKLAMDDCFEGDLFSAGLDSICCMLPDKTTFKIQITKL